MMKNKLFAKAMIVGLITFSLSYPAMAGEKPEVFVQLGHTEWVDSTAMSADGKIIASGASSGSIKLWDVLSGREIRTLVGHTFSVSSLAFSPDNRLIASWGLDKTCRLWDVQSGRQLQKIDAPVVGDVKTGFTPDGKYFWSTGFIDIIMAETVTGRRWGALDITGRESPSVIFSSSGKYALFRKKVSPTQIHLVLWNVMEGRIEKTFDRDEFYWAAFSPDDRYVLSPRRNQTLELWDLATGKEVRSFEKRPATGITEAIYSIRISDNGSYALSTTETAVTLWDFSSGRNLGTFQLPKDFRLVELSPDGKRLLLKNSSIAGDTVFKIADSSTGDGIKEFSSKQIGANYAAFSADGKQILFRGFGRLILWDLEKNQEVRRYEGQGHRLAFVAFAPDGKKFAANIGSGFIVWDIASAKVERIITGLEAVNSVVFSKDSNWILSGGADKIVRLWDLAVGKEAKTFIGHTAEVTSVAFSPDGRLVVSGSNDASVRVWSRETGREERTLIGHKYGSAGFSNFHQFTGVTSVAVNPDGQLAVSGGTDGAVIVWSLPSGKEIARLGGHARTVTSVAFSPDGKFIASGSLDGVAKLWELATRKELKTFTRKANDPVTYVGFSSDGRWLLTKIKGDYTSWLWDIATGKEIRSFTGDITSVMPGGSTFVTAAISSNANRVITVDSMGPVARLWDSSTGKEIARMSSFSDGEWVVITPEGYFNASPNGAKHLNVRVGNNVYGIDQFYAKFYRPELVQLALAGKEIPKGELITDIAAQKPAPHVQILSPVANSSVDQDNVAVTLKITDSGGGIGSVNVYLNGAQVANDTRGVIVKGKASVNERILSFTIPLIAGQNEIRAVAFNGENSMESNPALINVISNAVMQKPNLYALVIGINTYRNKSISLTYAVPDAIAFAGTLQKIASPLFEKADIRTLVTPEATTKEAVAKAFEEVRQMVKPNDLFIFYNASHGMVDVVNGEEQYFLLTSNVRLLSSRHISEDALSHKDLVRLIGSIPSQKKLVILDTCNAGKGGKEIQIALLQQTRGLTDATAVKLLQRAVGSSVFSASADTEQALEGYKGHGLFTYVLLEGLQGKADFKKDGFITVKGLDLYTGERVMTLSEEVFKRQQNPMIETGANDFPIGKIR